MRNLVGVCWVWGVVISGLPPALSDGLGICIRKKLRNHLQGTELSRSTTRRGVLSRLTPHSLINSDDCSMNIIGPVTIVNYKTMTALIKLKNTDKIRNASLNRMYAKSPHRTLLGGPTLILYR